MLLKESSILHHDMQAIFRRVFMATRHASAARGGSGGLCS